ncbi:MAG: helix-turn-helix transcriptional regulator [Methanoregulaceae archaeon]|nr:helix-turn-helix transcriptional regulator [Methanoregulaceae archaeon]
MNSFDVTQAFRALGDPTRRRIFEFLCERCCPVALEDTGEVHPVQGVTVGEVCCHVTGSEKFSSTVSFHIKELRLAGLIDAKKSGKFMICSARREAIDAMADYFRNLPKPDSTDYGPADSKDTNP